MKISWFVSLALSAVFGISPAFAGPAEDMLAQSGMTVDGLVAMCDNAKNTPPANEKERMTLDPVAYEALVLAYEKAVPNPKDFYRFDGKSPAEQAMWMVGKKYNLGSAAAFIDRALANPAPGVRAKAVELLAGGLFGNSEKNREIAKQLIAKESEKPVLAALVRVFANDGGRVPEIGAFFVKCLDDGDPAVRNTVAVFTPSSWNAKVPGLAEKFAEMIVKEPDAAVRKSVCERAGKLGNDVCVDAYRAALQDKNYTGPALKGLLSMWWGYPLYNTNSEKAYRLTLEFFQAAPAEAATWPAAMFASFSDLTLKSDRGLEKWKAASPWYKPEEVQTALLPLLAVKNLQGLVRVQIAKALVAHGMDKAQLLEKVEKEAADWGMRDYDLKSLKNTIEKAK